MMSAGAPEAYAEGRAAARRDGRARSTGSATAPATAARSRSSTSCSPACTSPPPPRRWRSACAKASTPAALYEVITHSAGNSWMFENRMAHVLAGDYTPLSAVDIFVKDLGLVLDTARATQVPAAAGEHRAPDVHAGVDRRLRREDDAAVIKIFPGHRAAERHEGDMSDPPRLHRRRLHRRHRPRQQAGARRHARGADDRRARRRRGRRSTPMRSSSR